MAADTSKWPQVRNYWLKFDDPDVYPKVFGAKEHTNTIKNNTKPLSIFLDSDSD